LVARQRISNVSILYTVAHKNAVHFTAHVFNQFPAKQCKNYPDQPSLVQCHIFMDHHLGRQWYMQGDTTKLHSLCWTSQCYE